MNWEAIGAIGELAGAFGVIFTIGYLAIQIRQNTKMMKASVREQRNVSASTSLQVLLGNADVLAKLSQGEELNLEENIRMDIGMRILFRSYETFYKQHSEGLLDDDEWQSMENSLKNQFARGAAPIWEGMRGDFSPGFQTCVDRIKRESDE